MIKLNEKQYEDNDIALLTIFEEIDLSKKSKILYRSLGKSDPLTDEKKYASYLISINPASFNIKNMSDDGPKVILPEFLCPTKRRTEIINNILYNITECTYEYDPMGIVKGKEIVEKFREKVIAKKIKYSM